MSKIKPHIYFLITAIIIFVIGLFFKNSENTIDINIHDTYFVITTFHFAILISIVLFLIGLIYYVFSKLKTLLVKSLTVLHTVITILCFPIYFFGSLYFSKTKLDSNFSLFDDDLNQNIFISIILIIFFLAQIILILNLIVSTIKYFILNSKS